MLDPQINNSVFGAYPVWSPVGNEVLYQRLNGSRFAITRAQVDGARAGADLANVTDTSGIAWLTDGSGMVAADYSDLLLSHVDLYRMTFADNNIVQLTQTSGRQAAFLPSVSPDSSRIVYGYTEDAEARPFNTELRIMNIDGSDDRLLVADGRRASWSRVAPQNPPPTPEPTVTTTPEPSATPQPQPTPGTTPDPGSAPGYKNYLPTISW